MKYFAILLFSFEMIAPALMLPGNGEADVVRGDYGKSYSNAAHSANFISSLLFEENNGEEEERESKDHRQNSCCTDFGFIHTYIELTTTETHHTAWVVPHKRAASQPALFTLFHTYLI